MSLRIGPAVDPRTLLTLVRSCVSGVAPIREDELRCYLPDVDACLDEIRRADARRPAVQKLVLLVLANRHNSETGRCDPSLARLAKDCGLGETCVKRTLVALSECGLLVRIRRKADGVFTSTTYAFEGVRRDATNVGAETPNPLSPDATNGWPSGDQGVRRDATINQEVKPGRETKEAEPGEKRTKLTVVRPNPKAQISTSEVPAGMPSEAEI